MNPRPETTLDGLLEFVNQTRGFDFTGYKRSSIQRRVAKRMAEVGVEGYDEYIDRLELHPDEFVELFNTVLINVTAFFRDPPAWEYLASSVLPDLIGSRPNDSPIRVWSAGCASGEEAYTLAMVLARVLGDQAFLDRVKIYATDVDDEALEQARHGAFAPRQIEDVPGDALERFFERTDQRYVFRKDLRRCVIFGRNDLVQDAPISRIDLLVCRNTLMYFTAETQSRVLRRFHFALDNDGVLMLGKSEMLITHADVFTAVDLKRRVFRKVLRPNSRVRTREIARDFAPSMSRGLADSLRESAFDVAGIAQVVVDADGSVVMANDSARRIFGLGVADLGRPIQDLELSYRPVELRPRLDEVSAQRRGVELKAVRWRVPGGRERFVDVRLTPLLGDDELIGTSIAYIDVTDAKHLEAELTSSKRELEQAYEELRSTVEELETTNEELQSTNEELETTNEELQSTNEELETMNEELHSSNEELETMNDELRHRTGELNDTNAFLDTVLSTIGLAVAVLDRQQRVQIWNRQARELWGLNSDDVENRPLLRLDFGLAIDLLEPILREVLNGSEQERIVVDATNRRGRAFRCQVTALPLGSDQDGSASGVIVMMEAVAD
ncbi:MAG TPA: CheR family methyltransferase [Solirubrobacteraceae bacterium]|nr:CheR family methyltransferase [Solirubrobacteraceae bacterium]